MSVNEQTAAERSQAADTPIQSSNADRLNRATFAKSIADRLHAWRGIESLVVALTGTWGSGKTSIKNMMLEILHQKPAAKKPYIVEFNPWQWSGTEKLSTAFYSEIYTALGRIDQSKQTQNAAKAWKSWAHTLQDVASAGNWLSNNYPSLLAVLALLIGVGVARLEQWQSELISTAAILAAIVIISAALHGISRKLSRHAESLEQRRPSVEDVRKDLKAFMKDLPRPILVVIDDIDRLSDAEIQIVFKHIKANSDFPNLIFLLLYQKDRVEAALSTIAGGAGGRYIEKLVQIVLDVPAIERWRIENIMHDEIMQILKSIPNYEFNQRRWQNIFIGAIRIYFGNLRDVYRLLGALEFSLDLFRGERLIEVNIIDLIALEVIRIYEPKVYSRLLLCRELLTGETYKAYENPENKRTIEALLDASDANREALKEILIEVFPTIAWALGGSHYGSDFSSGWAKDLRACTAGYFDRYFNLCVPSFDLSTSEFSDFFDDLGDYDSTVKRMRNFGERGLQRVAFSRLDDKKQDIPIEHAPSLLRALFDVGDELDHGFLAPFTNAWRIIYWYLQKNKDASSRDRIFIEALKSSNGFGVAASLIRLDEDNRKESKENPVFLLTDAGLSQARDEWIRKIRLIAFAPDSPLLENPILGRLIYNWALWAGSEEVKQWVDRVATTNTGLARLVEEFANEVSVQGSGEALAHKHFEFRLSDISSYANIDEWYTRLLQIDQSLCSEKQRKCIQAFIRAVDKRDGRHVDRLDDDF